jgi:plastocyanin
MRSKSKRCLLAILLSIANTGVHSQSAISSEVVSATSSGIASPATHTVNVGLADHKFEPDTIDAAVGDLVVFKFYPTNHSVVRAA